MGCVINKKADTECVLDCLVTPKSICIVPSVVVHPYTPYEFTSII